jgi:hypothetical protein
VALAFHSKQLLSRGLGAKELFLISLELANIDCAAKFANVAKVRLLT